MMDKVIREIEKRRDGYVGELAEFLAIPSVSTDPDRADDVRRCAVYCRDALDKIGFADAEVHETPGHPIVTAEWNGAAGAPTVLFYGHYDVQPVDPVELWTSPPFEATVRDGRIYGRGSADDKGQILCHWKAWEAHFEAHGKLPCNVKVLLEGEEEIGSRNLAPFIAANRDRLAADAVLISDSPMFARGVPSLCYGLRGLCYMEIHVRGAKSDLHSGSFGGAVANPAQALARILSGLKDHENHVAIEGFYDKVRPLSERERAEFRKLPFNEIEFRRQLEVPELVGEAGFTTLERIWARPALDINGMLSGFTGKGAKTVLPGEASAKVSMRLVPDQDPDEIAELFRRHVEAHAPPGVVVRADDLHGARPYIAPLDHPANRAAARALAQAFGAEPVFTREGGSIPVTVTFQEELGATSILMGFGLPDENAHAPDEHLDVQNFHGGVVTSAWFYEEYARGEE
ncbi:MAG TPA: dipeptidase [Gemmatimonadota bacterium]|nr:dipeptidase [Gemmatimonadota bacterium]